jgi:hypothetical protein
MTSSHGDSVRDLILSLVLDIAYIYIHLIPGAWPRDSLRSSLEVFSQEVLKVLHLVLLVVVVFLCMIKPIKNPQALAQE